MMFNFRKWPLPVQASISILLIVLTWSCASSTVLMLYLRQPLVTVPFTEFWSYWVHVPSPSWTDAQNSRALQGIKLAAVGTTLALLGIALLLLMRQSPRKGHDNARWATWEDMRQAGFGSRHGSYLGKMQGFWLRSGYGRMRRHMAVMAPTQSGKGVSFCIPSGLGDAREDLSVAFFDPKFQAFTKTAGWQYSLGANVILFSPLSETGQTAQYNPCAYVRRNPDGSPTVDTWGDIEGIVHKQIEAGHDKYEFWTDSARISYTAMLAFLSETDGAEFHIPAALDLMFRRDSASYILRALNERRAAGRPYSLPCALNLREFLEGDEEFREGIRKTIKSKLGIFFNPRVRAATSGNTFDLTCFQRERTAFYYGVYFNDVDKLRPLTGLLFQQMVGLNTRGLPGADPSVTHDLLIVLDEFTNMGRMPDLARAFSTALEYGVRLMPVFQTPASLVAEYGKDGAQRILDNCKDKVILGGIDDMEFCRSISERLGTVQGERRSHSGAWFSKVKTTVSETERPLFSKYEVSQLDPDMAILLHGGSPGALISRIRYYEQRPFMNRVMPMPPIPSITVDLRYDERLDDHASPSAPVPKVKGRARKAEPASVTGMSVAQAESVLKAVSPSVDLSQFTQPADARAQIDKVLRDLPNLKGRKP